MYNIKLLKRSVFLGLLIILLVAITIQTSFAKDDTEAKVTFAVGWFDVGKEALERLEGVKKVEKGFYKSMEINTVYYDPSKVTIEEMENALKKAGTYKKTLKEPIK